MIHVVRGVRGPVLLLVLGVLLVPSLAMAQADSLGIGGIRDAPVPATDTATVGPDYEVQFSTPMDSIPVVQVDKTHSPRKALFLSLALPGAGQAYNKKYWKMPIIYAGLGTTIFFVIYNNGLYQESRTAFNNWEGDGISTARINGVTYRTEAGVRLARDTYRRWRDLNVIFSVLLYAMNAVDAYVDAHLIDFGRNKDNWLSLHPYAPGPAWDSRPVHGFTLQLNLSR